MTQRHSKPAIACCYTEKKSLSFVFAMLVILLYNSDTVQSQKELCSDCCEFDPGTSGSTYIDVQSCTEKVNYGVQHFKIFEDDGNCYKGEILQFPAYIENVSSGLTDKTFSVAVTWKWPPVDAPYDTGDHRRYWGIQYSITVSGDNRVSCHNVLLSRNNYVQGTLNVPCLKSRDDGFSNREFKVTFLAYVVEIKAYKLPQLVPTRLQEVAFHLAEKTVNSSLSVWNLNMTHHITDKVLSVSFTPAPPAFNYTTYEVQVFRASSSKCITGSSPLDNIQVERSMQRTSVHFNLSEYEECAKYCVTVHSIRQLPENHSSKTCVTELRDTQLFYVPPRVLKCVNWNAYFVLETDAFQSEIQVSFEIYKEYDFCFERLKMVLLRQSSDVCTEDGEVASQMFMWNSTKIVITFNDEKIVPGKYCVMVYPQHRSCEKNQSICSGRYSKVVTLSDNVPIPTSDAPEESHALLNRILIICILSVVGLIVLVAIAGILWRKSHPPIHTNIHMSDFPFSAAGIRMNNWEGHSRENLVLLDPHREVVILYTHEEQTRKRVRALSNFLRNCKNYEVILDEDHLAKISVDKLGFMREILNYTCSENELKDFNNDRKRIIIVESRSAERLLKTKCSVIKQIMNSHSVKHRNVDLIQLDWDESAVSAEDDKKETSGIYKQLDDMFFCPAISCITTNRQSFVDDCHIFIVGFDDSVMAEREIFNHLFPGNRYRLPSQLGNLCLNLNRIDHPTDPMERSTKIDQMLRLWENHESYKELLAACTVHD